MANGVQVPQEKIDARLRSRILQALPRLGRNEDFLVVVEWLDQELLAQDELNRRMKSEQRDEGAGMSNQLACILNAFEFAAFGLDDKNRPKHTFETKAVR